MDAVFMHDICTHLSPRVYILKETAYSITAGLKSKVI